MYVHLNSIDVDFWIVYFEDLFFYTLVVQLPLNSRLIDLIDLIVTISIIETEYLLNPGPASPYIVLTVTDHTNLMLSVFHPPTYILQFFWLKYPLINCINANFLTNHERLNSKPTQGQLRQLSSISNFFDKLRLV